MKPRYAKDWTTLTGASVEIRLQGTTVDSGLVDAVIDDGTILWIRNPAPARKLYEKAEYYEAWVIEEATGLLPRSPVDPQ